MTPDYEPNPSAGPLSVAGKDIRPGNTVVNVGKGKPIFRVVDTQKSESDDFPTGVIAEYTDAPGSLSFVPESKLREFIESPGYRV